MSANVAHGPDRSPQAGEHDLAADSPSLLATVRSACAARGLDATGIRLLHHDSNAVVLLPSEGAVARVVTGRHDVAQIWLATFDGLRAGDTSTIWTAL